MTNLELQVEETKSEFKEFDQEIRRRLNDDEPLEVEGDKPNPEDWAEFMEFDQDFQDEFDNVVSNKDIKEQKRTSPLKFMMILTLIWSLRFQQVTALSRLSRVSLSE